MSPKRSINEMKKTLSIIALVTVFGVAGFLLGKSSLLEYFSSSPSITIVNLTGVPILDVTVILGPATEKVGDLKHTLSRTVRVRDHFGESATNIEWRDNEGIHKAIADDYVENYGFYHSTIVLTDDRKAVVVREIRESNK